MGFRVGSISPSKFVVGSGFTTIQAAITAAAAAGGGVVQIPKGTYAEDLTLQDTVALQGFGNPFDTLDGGSGVVIVGHHTQVGGTSSLTNICFVNDGAGPTIAFSGALGFVTIRECIFLLDAASAAGHYHLSMVNTAGRVSVYDSSLYDLDSTLVVNTTVTHLIHSVPAAGSHEVNLRNTQVLRADASPPGKAIHVEGASSVELIACDVNGYVELTSACTVVARGCKFDVAFSGAATTPAPTFKTNNNTSKLELMSCQVRSYGSAWFTGPGEIYTHTPVLPVEGGTSLNSPPFFQSLPLGLDIVSITKANPALVTTNTAHGLAVGDLILILGHQNPILNRTHTVLSTPSGTTFTINANTLDANSYAPAAITGTTAAAGVGTVSVANTAGLVAGEIVWILDHDVAAFNGVHEIQSVPNGTDFTIDVPIGTASPGAASGMVYRNSIGTPIDGTTVGGVVVKSASGVMRPLLSSALGVFETTAAHGFVVNDWVLIVDHDAESGSAYMQMVTAVGDATHFTLTATAFNGTQKGVAVLMPRSSRTKPSRGPVVLSQVDDTVPGGITSGQYPAGTLYLDKSVPGALPDIRGVIAPGVSRSLGNRVNVTADGTTGLLPVTWNDEVIIAYNFAAPIIFFLPTTLEEGAYQGRVLTLVAQFDPSVHSVSVQSPKGNLYWAGSQDLSGGQAILSLAAHRSVTLVCVSAPTAADIINDKVTTGSTWAIVSRGA